MHHRVVACVPAGRRRYMEVLAPHLLRNRHIIHEVQLWANTTDGEDLTFLHELSVQHAGYFRIILPKTTPAGCATICQFWTHTTDPDTIYVRTDDDIVWIGSEAISRLVECRVARPQPFLIFGNIVNNGICSYIHQRQGCLPLTAGIVTPNVTCSTGWRNPRFAEAVHRAFLKHLNESQTDAFLFGNWTLCEYERFSINVCAWFGKDFNPKDPDAMKGNEEYWVCCVRPRQLGRPNEICGQALFSHFAFYTQRDYMDTTNILAEYRRITSEMAGNKTH